VIFVASPAPYLLLRLCFCLRFRMLAFTCLVLAVHHIPHPAILDLRRSCLQHRKTREPNIEIEMKTETLKQTR
jgi:hypothetical protein